MLSEYEQLREARIAQNRQRLKDLGILDDVEHLRAMHQAKRQPTSTSRPAPRETPHQAAPVRQSVRLRRKAGHILPEEDLEMEDKENAFSTPSTHASRYLLHMCLRCGEYLTKP